MENIDREKITGKKSQGTIDWGIIDGKQVL